MIHAFRNINIARPLRPREVAKDACTDYCLQISAFHQMLYSSHNASRISWPVRLQLGGIKPLDRIQEGVWFCSHTVAQLFHMDGLQAVHLVLLKQKIDPLIEFAIWTRICTLLNQSQPCTANEDA